MFSVGIDLSDAVFDSYISSYLRGYITKTKLAFSNTRLCSSLFCFHRHLLDDFTRVKDTGLVSTDFFVRHGYSILVKSAKRLLPKSTYNFLRYLIHRRRKRNAKRVPKISECEFRRILTDDLGVQKGSVVFVHSSVNNMNLDFPFYCVLSILLEVVGKEGTLLFPTAHTTERPEEHLKRGDIFDVKRSPTKLGIIPEFARRQKGAIRSLHPTNSVAAIGKYARELTKDHPKSIYPLGAQSPYYKIVHYDGIIIGLGVSTETLSFAHCVEDNLQDDFPVQTRDDQIFEGKVRDTDGTEHLVKTLVAHKRIRRRNVSRYMRRHIPADICRDLNINRVKYFTAHSKELYAKMEELAVRNITIYSKLVYRE